MSSLLLFFAVSRHKIKHRLTGVFGEKTKMNIGLSSSARSSAKKTNA